MPSPGNSLVRSRWFAPLVAFGAVCAVVFAFAWPVILDGRVLFHTHLEYPPTDETSVHLPLHAEVGRQSAAGELPLMNQWPAFGLPLAADPDALVFDPFMAVFRGVAMDTVVLSWRSIVMGMVGAMAVFGFLWLFGVGLAGSVSGAAVYASLVLRYPPAEELLIHYVATDWSMTGLFLLALAVRRKVAWAFPAAGVASGFAALSGHPQGVYFGLALGVLYILGEGWPRRGAPWKAVLQGGAGWLAVALAVASVQLLPLAANIESTLHLFADPSRPEFDEDLVGYALAILGPAAVLAVVLPMRRRWLEIGVFALSVLFVLTIMNTPIVRLWHAIVPMFDNFKLSSKYFVSPFPVLAAIAIGLAIGVVSGWAGRAGRIALFSCGFMALWPVLSAPYGIVYRLQQPAAVVEDLDQACLSDIRDATPPFGRVLRFDTRAMYPSLTVTAELFDVQVLATSLPIRYSEVMMAITPEGATAIRQDSNVGPVLDPARLDLAFWDVAGVTTLISGREVVARGWEPVLARPDSTCMTGDRGYFIYRNVEAFDRAFLIDGDAVLSGRPEDLAFVINPATTVPRLAAGNVRIADYSGSRVRIEVDAAAPCRLVLSDGIADGWGVLVDGRPAAAVTSWYLFRAVDLPAGKHTVTWEYRPPAVFAGLAIGGAGLAAAILWVIAAAFVLPLRRKRFRDPGSKASPDSA